MAAKKTNTKPVTSYQGKIQPQATDLEEAVLGALMLENDALSNSIEILRSSTTNINTITKIDSTTWC